MPLSYSQLNSYRTCPRQYEYGFVKKISRSISAGESFGSSVHNTLKKWGEMEMGLKDGVEEGQLPLFVGDDDPDPEPLSLEVLQDLWHQSFIVQGYENRAAADFARERGVKLMEHFYTWWEREERHVVAVEKGFKLHEGEVFVSGRFDRIESLGDEGLRVIDYKTTKPRTQQEVDADLQLSIYAAAVEKSLKKPCRELLLLFLSDEGVVEMKTERGSGQIKDALTQIGSMKERIDAKDFHPTPSVDVCRGCPYKNVCDVSAV